MHSVRFFKTGTLVIRIYLMTDNIKKIIWLLWTKVKADYL